MTIQINGYEFPLRQYLQFFERSALRNAIGSTRYQKLLDEKKVQILSGNPEVWAFKDEREIYLDYAETKIPMRQVAAIHSQ